MKSVLILIYFNEHGFPINGTTFHIYELGLKLQEYGFDVVVYNPFKSDHLSIKILESKYTNKLTMTNEFHVNNNNILLTSQFTTDNISYYNFTQAKICIHVITDMFKEKMENYLQLDKNMFIFSNKILWMYDDRIISSWSEPIDSIMMNKIINSKCNKIVYKWGLLQDPYYLKNQNLLSLSKKWLIYAKEYKGLSTSELVDKAIQYCDSLNLDYDIDTLNIRSPESYYAGLVYAKNQDFSGRLPFEFAMHNKPVKFIGTNKFYRDYLNISLETTQLEIPRLDISNLASYLESV